jgi:hypothetical protein
MVLLEQQTSIRFPSVFGIGKRQVMDLIATGVGIKVGAVGCRKEKGRSSGKTLIVPGKQSRPHIAVLAEAL